MKKPYLSLSIFARFSSRRWTGPERATSFPGVVVSRVSRLWLSILFLAPSALIFSRAPVVKIPPLKNMGPSLNTPSDDYSPTFSSDGKTMIFNARRDGQKYMDLYISRRSDTGWTKPQPIKELNSPYNDETPYLFPNGKIIIFSSDRDGSKEMPADVTGKIKVSGDLYSSHFKNGKWSPPQPLPGDVNSIHHEKSPVMAPDGLTLFYVQWPFGNIQKSRIMKAHFLNGTFVKKGLVSEKVNSGHQELGLTLAPGGKGLYFSSRKPGGFGGWDIYFTPFTKEGFGKIENAGPEINSPANDLYLNILKDETIFLCSNRKGGLGRYDLYSTKSTGLKPARFQVLDVRTGKPVETKATVEAWLPGSAKIAASVGKKTGNGGTFQFKFMPGLDRIRVRVHEPGYLPLKRTYQTADLMNGKLNKLKLIPLEKNQSFTIHDIHFDFNSAQIRSDSYPYLKQLVEYLARDKSSRFKIIGHTDLHGNDDFNDKLSLERARSVRNYLVSQGLAEKRFEIEGRGKREPLVDRKGEGYDQQNRRTEFRLLGRD